MARMERYEFHLTDKEPLFDVADAMRFGKDIFIQHSGPSNHSGIDWFKRHFESRGYRVHVLGFGGTIQPWHIDVTILRLLDGSRAYVHAVIDNFSGKILAWTVAEKLDPTNTCLVLEEAALRMFSSAEQLTFWQHSRIKSPRAADPDRATAPPAAAAHP